MLDWIRLGVLLDIVCWELNAPKPPPPQPPRGGFNLLPQPPTPPPNHQHRPQAGEMGGRAPGKVGEGVKELPKLKAGGAAHLLDFDVKNIISVLNRKHTKSQFSFQKDKH